MIDRDIYLMEEGPVPEISLYKSRFILSKIHKTIQEKRLKRVFLRIAVALIPFVMILGFGIYLNSHIHIFGTPIYAEIYIPNGERARILFHDGSEVHLNSGTKIRYPQKFGLHRRDVYLQGEAYFNIATNHRRPFTVHSGNTSVKVLGTSFNINAYENSDDMIVTLDKGKIAFNTATNSYPIMPGQEIVYNRNTNESRITMLARPSNKSLWKNDVIFMDDMPLMNVLELLERRFDVRFNVKKDDVLNYSYTLTTRQKTLEGVLGEMQIIAPVKFKRVGDSIEVFLN
jgi:ferric-dicitrate binding protein FerR (iron transport regulator)